MQKYDGHLYIPILAPVQYTAALLYSKVTSISSENEPIHKISMFLDLYGQNKICTVINKWK